MKLILIFFLILVFHINPILAQETNDKLKTDSIEIVNSNSNSNHGLSGYASKIGYNDFNKGVVVSPMQLIQGKVPGFVINNLNGNDPNPNLQIQLRGISTLFLSTEPMYIFDGIPVESTDIVPVENIESIEVLKSLSETAAYGIRGANGVVIIKTKRSSSKPLTISYDTYFYGEAFAKKSSYITASEWRDRKQNWASSVYPALNGRSQQMTDYNANTDWRKEISQNKLSQTHHLGFLGGYKKTSYSVLLNYNNYNGIIQKTGNTSYSGQLSVSQLALKDKLQVDISAIATNRKYSEMNDNRYLTYTDPDTGLKSSNIISSAYNYNPTIPVYNTDGTYGTETTPYYNINPVNRLNNTTDNRETKNTLINVQVSYEIIKGLKFSTSWSEYKIATVNSFSNYNRTQTSSEYLAQTKETNDQKERIYSVKLNFNKSIAFHSFDVSLNYSNQHNDINYDYRDSVIANGTQLTSRNWNTNDGNFDIKNLSGSFKYNYKSKYYLSFDILKETSPFYNWGGSAQYFPSLSAAWSLGNEKLLANIKWLNELKIRAGYGVGQRMIKLADNSTTQSNILPNPGLHGEKMKELNTGADVRLLSNRLCFSVDYYNRKTQDGVEKIYTSQFSVIINKTEIQNKGWEFYIKAQPFIDQLKWAFDFNISFNSNVVLTEFYKYGQNYKGQPIDNVYGYQFAGFSATDEMQVYDNDGNVTTINPNYRKKLGNGIPKSFFGFTNTFGYKNFDLLIFVRGGLGFEITNFTKLDENRRSMQSADQGEIINSYRLKTTDFIIEKGDYLKIANISFGYNIPIEKRFIKSAKVYIGCNNVALFTKVADVDPEMAGITGQYPGNYNYERYPETRIFSLGLKVIL